MSQTETPPADTWPDEEASPPPDRTLSGRVVGECLVVAHLGEGGYGTVYRAIDQRTGRPVAIKVVRPGGRSGEDVIRKFLNGAIAASQVEHPNIVRILRVGLDPKRGRHYIVMEHLRGRTLQAVLEERGPMPAKEALPILLAVAEGLGAAHAHDVIHRDVKPDNVMLLDDGTVRITDLGLARRVDRERRTTRVMGTAHFMAPEQFEGRGMDHRTDIFALGVTAYYLLSGTFPYPGRTPQQIIYAVLSSEPRPLGEAAPSVPADVVSLVHRMIARRPEDRPASMEDVATAFRAALAEA